MANFYSPQCKNYSRDPDPARLGDSQSSQGQLHHKSSHGQPVYKIWSLWPQLFRRYYTGCKILKRITWPWPRPFQGRFFIGGVGFAMVKLYTKFEVSRCTRYEAMKHTHTHTHKHTHPFNGPFPELPRWAGTRKVKPIWILLKQETVSGSGISWAICSLHLAPDR